MFWNVSFGQNPVLSLCFCSIINRIKSFNYTETLKKIRLLLMKHGTHCYDVTYWLCVFPFAKMSAWNLYYTSSLHDVVFVVMTVILSWYNTFIPFCLYCQIIRKQEFVWKEKYFIMYVKKCKNDDAFKQLKEK